MMTNMTNTVNNVANTLRETGLAHIDVDLYHALMDLALLRKHSLLPSLTCWTTNTTGGALFAEGPGHSAKAQKPSAKALPSAALGKEPSEKKFNGKETLC